MKKLILSAISIALASFTLQAQTQIPNNGFENWSGNNPVNWGTSDAVIVSLGQADPGGVEQETTPANVNSGSSSIRIKTDSVTITLIGQSLLLPGVASLGTLTLNLQTFSPDIKGISYTDRPDSFQLAYKYTSGNLGLDTGIAIVRLTKFVAGETKEIGLGLAVLTNSATFKTEKVKIEYQSILAPDTMYIQLLSSASESGGYRGSTLWADDLAVSGLDTAFKAYMSPVGETEICQGDALEMIADVVNGYSYRWLKNGAPVNGATTETFYATESGLYTVEITSGGRVDTSAPMNLIVRPLPTVTLTGNPDTLCSNAASVTLSGESPAGGEFTGNGVTGNSFNPANAGLGNKTITYTYSDDLGCTNTATEVINVRLCTSIESVDADFNVSVFPNPAQDRFTVKADNKLIGTELIIYDALGKVVSQQTINAEQTVVDAAAFNTGNYIFQIVNKENKIMVNGKVAVQK